MKKRTADKAFPYSPTAAICVGLVLLTLAVYWQAFGFGFLSFDDDVYVTNNTIVKSGLTASGFARAFTTPVSSNWHPLTVLSHMLDVELFGLNAGAHHLANVLLHCTNAVLLMLFLTMVTGKPWRSGMAAALFAVHPLHVESVAWISERKDVLSTLFWMLTMLAYVRWVRKPAFSRYAAVVLLFALGLMAKPMLVTLPIVLLILDWWPLGRFGFGSPGRLLLEKLPLLALSAASSAATVWAQHAGGAMSDLATFPTGVRVANAVVSYVSYIGKAVWPARLAVFYPHPESSLPELQVAASAALLVLVTAWSARCRKSRPYMLAGWLWYVSTLLPVSGIVQVGAQGMADRYTYLPLIGLFLMIVWSVPEIETNWLRRLANGAAAAAVAALAACAYFQVGYWRSDESLFARAVEVTRRNPFAYAHLAAAVRDRGDLEGAAELFRQAAEMAPQNASVQRELGTALMKLQRLSEALEHLDAAVRLDPSDANAHTAMGITLAMLGRLRDALPRFKSAARLAPNESKFRGNLGQCLFLLGEMKLAESEFLEALKLDPDNAAAAANYARLLAQEGRTAEAKATISRAMEIGADDPEVQRTAEQVLRQIRSR